jgi:transcriptional regulator with XRE-family HTH domain
MNEAGMTTSELASAMDLSVLAVQRHMRGDNYPDIETLALYARTLNVSTDALLLWAPWDSNPQPTDPEVVEEVVEEVAA